MKRTLLAALVGGIVIFVWGSVANVMLPLGKMGRSSAPAEAEVIATLKANLPEPGTYFLPDVEDVPHEQLPASGPIAFLTWRPDAAYTMGRYLVLEFTSGLLAALVAALVLCRCMGGVSVAKAGIATMALGLFGWLSISASHWTWYGFSTGFFVSEGIQQAFGWLVAGLAMGAVLRRSGGS